jgi:hypothetical protein
MSHEQPLDARHPLRRLPHTLIILSCLFSGSAIAFGGHGDMTRAAVGTGPGTTMGELVISFDGNEFHFGAEVVDKLRYASQHADDETTNARLLAAGSLEGMWLDPIAHCDNEEIEACTTRMIHAKAFASATFLNDEATVASIVAAAALDPDPTRLVELTVDRDGIRGLDLGGKDPHYVVGMALHAIQDFYSHTNWIDADGLNMPAYNNDLGRVGSSALGAAASACDGEGDYAGLSTTTLTSGYYVYDAERRAEHGDDLKLICEIPDGKCSHSETARSACGGNTEEPLRILGIAKDSSSHRGHIKAYSQAIESTRDYLCQVARAIVDGGGGDDVRIAAALSEFSGDSAPTSTATQAFTCASLHGAPESTTPGAYVKLFGSYRSQEWTNAAALVGHDAMLYGFQGGNLWRVSPVNGSYGRLPGDWSDTVAATRLGAYLYAVQSDTLYEVDPTDGDFRRLGNVDDWTNTVAMTAMDTARYGSRLYVIQNNMLWRVDPVDGSYSNLGDYWADTAAMTSHDGDLYVVQNSMLRRADEDGVYVRLTDPVWQNTAAMTTFEDHLYIIQSDTLYRVDPNDCTQSDCDRTVLGAEDDWNDTATMTIHGDNLYVIQDGRLWAVTP